MANEEWQVVKLRDDFYRDSIRKMIFIIFSMLLAIFLLGCLSFYIYISKPKPVNFPTYEDWRVQASVPVNVPYLTTPDVVQWVADTIQRVFVYDFVHYNDQLKIASPFFTPDGWTIFLNQLNIYANYNNVQANRLFVNGVLVGAPYVLNEGLLSGRYAWWVQVPVSITYAGYNTPPSQTLTLQVLVVRVPTLNNLFGVGIDNVIVAKNTGSQASGNV